MKGLTKRQKEVLDFLSGYIEAQQYPPTIREIAEHFGISVKGSYDHVKALEKKNFIQCNVNRSRAIKVLATAQGVRDGLRLIPLLGTVAAGRPLFAEENFEGHVELPQQFVEKGKHFALRIRGDSMKNAGILEGDIAVVRHQSTANNGEIVVAMVDEAVTLKKFFLEKNRVQLKAENPAYPPIYTQNVRILGKLTYLIRNYE